MRRNVTLGFSEEEYLRLQGAAAVARMPVATYLKWLLQSGGGNVNGDMSLILSRLDEVCVALARRPALPDVPAGKLQAALPSRELLTTRLRERGIPSTTIRQLTAVLDDVEVRP